MITFPFISVISNVLLNCYIFYLAHLQGASWPQPVVHFLLYRTNAAVARKKWQFVKNRSNRFKFLHSFDVVKHFLFIFEKQSRTCGIKFNKNADD